MKKIFRLASVLALAGVALMYTGCTKDYDADIKAIKTDLADLQSGTITNQSQQIAALQAQAASLQTIAGQFQQTLEGLQAAKADKTAVAADKAELLKKISEMEVSISKQISEINAAIADINEIIATKADKSWVEQTFATKTALATVESTLGSVEGRVSAIEGKLANLGVDLDEVEKTLDKVSLTATKAAADATAALGEIDAVKQSLENYYKKGEVVALIEEAKTELQGQIEALDKTIASVDASKESKEDAAKTKTELLAKIKTLQSNHQALMKFTNSLSDTVDVRFDRVNLELTALAAKIAGVEKAYKEADEALEKAYKNADVEINKEIEKLQKALQDEVEAREKALKEEIEARENAIEEEAALRAGADSTELAARKAALEQEIADRNEAIQKATDDVRDSLRQEIADRQAEISRIEGMINQEIADRGLSEAAIKDSIRQEIADRKQAVSDAIKYLNDSIDQEIADRKAAIETEAKARREAIQAVQDSLDNACEMIKANKLSIDQEIANREQAIIDLNNKLTAYSDSLKNHVETEILGLSKRIKSVSVYPTTNPELVRYVVGNDSSLVLITTFQVKPASAAKNITADQLKLFYGYATERGTGRNTRAQLVNKKAVTIEAANDFGLIKVKAVKLAEDTKNILDATDANQLFFALEITDQDTVGEYTIMSEYQNPVYGKSYNLDTKFTANAYSVNAKIQKYTTSEIDYTLCKDTLINPVFPTAKIMVEYTRPDKATEIVSIDDFQKFSGMKFNVSDTVYIRTEHVTALPNDSCLVLKKDANQALKTRARFKNNTAETTFKLYVGEVDTVVYHPIINEKDVDVEFRHAFEIIKHIKAEVSKNFRVYWNYINCYENNDAHSKDTLKYIASITNEPTTKTSLDWWSYCINNSHVWYAGGNNNTKSEELKLQGGEGYNFELVLYNAQNVQGYYSDLYVYRPDFTTKPMHFEDVLKKEDDYNRYNFNISVDIDSVPPTQVKTFDLGTLNTSLTKANTIAISVKDIEDKFICDFTGTDTIIDSYLVQGLEQNEIDAKKVISLFNDVDFKIDSLTINGVKKNENTYLSSLNVKHTAKADSIFFKAGAIFPYETVVVYLSKKVFKEVNYVAIVKFDCAAPYLRLKTTNYIVDKEETEKNLKGNVQQFMGYTGKSAEVLGKVLNNTYSIEDMYLREYYRVEKNPDFAGVPADFEILDNVKVYFKTTKESTSNSPFMVSQTGSWSEKPGNFSTQGATLNYDGQTGEITINPDLRFEWDNYIGRATILKPTIKVPSVTGGEREIVTKDEDLKVLFWTKAPVKLANSNNINDKRLAGQDLNIPLWKSIVINGVKEGVYQTTNLVGSTNGALSSTYFDSNRGDGLKYQINDTAIVNGKPYLLVKNVDYKFIGANNDTLQILGNNVLGECEITIYPTLQYYLDYNHSAKDKELQYLAPNADGIVRGIQMNSFKIYLNKKN